MAKVKKLYLEAKDKKCFASDFSDDDVSKIKMDTEGQNIDKSVNIAKKITDAKDTKLYVKLTFSLAGQKDVSKDFVIDGFMLSLKEYNFSDGFIFENSISKILTIDILSKAVKAQGETDPAKKVTFSYSSNDKSIYEQTGSNDENQIIVLKSQSDMSICLEKYNYINITLANADNPIITQGNNKHVNKTIKMEKNKAKKHFHLNID